jgi:putative tryptophan/tyrosine transport system substrate-binding protein
MTAWIRRRAFITLIGGAAAWPLAARAQQSAIPVIGYLYSGAPETSAPWVAAFRKGLSEVGFFEGRNVEIEYRWANNDPDRLPGLADDLVRRRVAVIVAATIPIVFAINEDPVRLGLVGSLARPGGNLTGINFLAGELQAKRLELLRELVPGVVRVAVLVNPTNPTNAERTVRDVEAAARALGLQIQVLNASTSREIDAAFATLGRERFDALFVGGDGFFASRRVQIAVLAAQRSIPATYSQREYAEAGGLMSYGTNQEDAWRQLGVYVSRILKGATPADMPVVQATKFELVINHQTARSLGLTVPDKLLVAADEVIE